MSGPYEEDETIPEQWRPRRESPLHADTTPMVPVSPPRAPRPPEAAGPQPPRPPRRAFPAAAAGLIVAFAVLIGVAIGHDVWSASTPTTTVADNGFSAEPSIPTPTIVPGGGSAQSPSVPSFSGGGSSSAGGSGSSASGSGGSGSAAAGSSGSAATPASGAPANAESIASKVDPALVDINSTFPDAEGAGTGIVLSSNGEVLTNNHVIDQSTSLSVTDIGNGKTYKATVVGYDHSHDIAVLQLQGASGLTTAKLGDSSTASTGQPVVAIGNAGGTGGTPSTAAGSIVGIGKSITAGDELDESTEQLSGLIEVNADVQAGDSGGSLVNSSGEVIGVDTAASEGFSFASSSNDGFAIPINQALTIAQQIESGTSTSSVHVGPTAFIGVEIEPTASQQTGGGGFGGGGYGGYGGGGYGGGGGASTTSGVPVEGVLSGTAASKTDLASGDVITSLDGQTIDSSTALTDTIVQLKPGQSVQIGWQDPQGQSHTATVDLGSGPPA